MIPDNPDALLTRSQTALALTAAGYPVTTGTLATKACRHEGPAYRLFGRRPLYRWGDALDWVRGRVTIPCQGAPASAPASDQHVAA
jgi:hypothetical protein